MKRPSVFHRIPFLVFVAVAVPQWALADEIVVQSEFRTCVIVDSGPRFHTLTVWHMFSPGAIAVRFKIDTTPSMTMTYVSETHAWPTTVGNMRDGMSICYGSCQQGNMALGTLTYQGYGTSTPCAQFVVKPHPDAETLDVVDCGHQPKAAKVYHFEVLGPQNPGCNLCIDHDPGTSYQGTPVVFDCQPLPIRASTWGAIKALYN